MLLTGNKQEEQTPLVHWENFLIMVTIPLLRIRFSLVSPLDFHSFVVFNMFWQISLSPTKLQGVMLLHVRYVLEFLFFSFFFFQMLRRWWLKFDFKTFLVWGLGIWKHCYVWAEYFLVLGHISGYFLLCYMGTVSKQIWLLMELVICMILMYLIYRICLNVLLVYGKCGP